MVHRRGVFKVLAKAMITGAGWFGSNLTILPLLGAETGRNAAGRPRSAGTLEEQLQAEMTSLAHRVYSEQGIAMVLACEHVVAPASATSFAKEMNAEFAPAFHTYAEAWKRLHPGAPSTDVASLVELLASRDFASGGRSASL